MTAMHVVQANGLRRECYNAASVAARRAKIVRGAGYSAWVSSIDRENGVAFVSITKGFHESLAHVPAVEELE